MQDIDRGKQHLRKQLLARRRELLPEQVEACSIALTQELVKHPLWREARGIAAFVGVRNEPDTAALLERSLAAGKVVWLPRLTEGGSMRFWPCADFAVLLPGRMGLREPPIVEEGLLAPGPEHGVDLVLVPGLGFGRDGARLGFGAGHYDRAFASRREGTVVMPTLCGVCFTDFLDPLGPGEPGEPGGPGAQPIPMLEHDLHMHYVATEFGVERCRARV